MSARPAPRVLTIAPGAPFLSTLVETFLDGRLLPGFRYNGDPLSLADATIYVPTRRAARELRGVFVDRLGGGAAILPVIRPLGEFDEDDDLFDPSGDPSALDPPIASVDRLLLLAPLVRSWKRRLPAEVAQRFAEEVVVPASAADALWLARDLAGLIDEVDTHGADWASLRTLVADDYAGWWQVTLEFLRIVTEHWPAILRERGLSAPAAHRSAALRAEAARLRMAPHAGPVIAAGSTGSIPATADLLAAISVLPSGAVVLPGLDLAMDAASWSLVADPAAGPAIFGHPQFGLAKLIRHLRIGRDEVVEIGVRPPSLAVRAALAAEAFRPADETDAWPERRAEFAQGDVAAAFEDVALIEAANERDEAAAVATALRHAVADPDGTAALVTTDRDLARRVCTELLRFGIRADDSAGTPLSGTAPAGLLRLMVRCVHEAGDPVPVVALLKHPLLRAGFDRSVVRRAADTIELVALRGGYGRPDLIHLGALFEERLDALASADRKPSWLARLDEHRLDEARRVIAALTAALAPASAAASAGTVTLTAMARAGTMALEGLAAAPDGGVADLYAGDAGTALAAFLRGLVASAASLDFDAREWPDVLDALLATATVKPSQGADPRVSVWGALEARLMACDTLVIGGLNEGAWPRKVVADRFMSRMMKAGIALEPPERRIGQAAHDFQMALGAPRAVLTRSLRAGDAPAVPSRWLQRLLAFLGPAEGGRMRARGRDLLAWSHALDAPLPSEPAVRPQPAPPLALRPRRFSITEIETLRRDPYAIYARRILGLEPLEPLLRDPGAADRGTLFHLILHRFATEVADPTSPGALAALLAIGGTCFEVYCLPPDVYAVWWPRFRKLATNIMAWETGRAGGIIARLSEVRAVPTEIGRTGVVLSGMADRIDLRPSGLADVLDIKTGSSPSAKQAHHLVSPQLALEAALLRRNAFPGAEGREPADLAYVRLKARGEVAEESILEIGGKDRSIRSAAELAEDAWARLERLVAHYAVAANGYRSRVLPVRETLEGPYDHLARVLEWSAGSDEGSDGEPE